MRDWCGRTCCRSASRCSKRERRGTLQRLEQFFERERERPRCTEGIPGEALALDLRPVVTRTPNLHLAPVRIHDPVDRHTGFLVATPLGEPVLTRADRTQHLRDEQEGPTPRRLREWTGRKPRRPRCSSAEPGRTRQTRCSARFLIQRNLKGRFPAVQPAFRRRVPTSARGRSARKDLPSCWVNRPEAGPLAQGKLAPDSVVPWRPSPDAGRSNRLSCSR